MNTTAPLHVIAGAGQIGPMVAERLVARGLRVRMIRRGTFASAPVGVETVSAPLADPAAAAEAMRGASVVYHCANPASYSKWRAELLPLTRGIVAGAEAAGAKLVALDNLYSYRVPADGVLREDTAVDPVATKGALRAEAARILLAAKVPVAIGRASDFIGPRCTHSLFGERFWPRLFAGKAVEVVGDPDQPHAYSYGPDVAGGLVELGLADDATGVWHLPVLPAESTRTWIERLAREAAVATPKLANLSPFLLRIAGVVMRDAGELREMIYQWRTPFVLDDHKFRARFGLAPTPVAPVVAATVAWARGEFAARAAA